MSGGGRAYLHHPARQAVAQLSALVQPRKPVDVAALRVLTARIPMQQESAADFVRLMRDESRY